MLRAWLEMTKVISQSHRSKILFDLKSHVAQCFLVFLAALC